MRLSKEESEVIYQAVIENTSEQRLLRKRFEAFEKKLEAVSKQLNIIALREHHNTHHNDDLNEIHRIQSKLNSIHNSLNGINQGHEALLSGLREIATNVIFNGGKLRKGLFRLGIVIIGLLAIIGLQVL